jgi:transcriptional regulator with XRE-family HTH domain
MAPEPTRLRRQLGSELRTVRTLAKLTQYDLVVPVGSSQATIARIEQGRALPSREAVVKWLDAGSADDDVRERVLTLTAAAHAETWSWDEPLGGDVTHLQGIARQREIEARLVRGYHFQWIPGLLQTAGYARGMLPLVDPTGRMDIAAAVAARMERQQILYETGRKFEFLIEENALQWAPSDGVMAGQRGHLLALAGLDSVEVRILPAARIGAPSWTGFILWTNKDGDTFVTAEFLHGGTVITDTGQVASYETLWKQLWETAIAGDEATHLIRGL